MTSVEEYTGAFNAVLNALVRGLPDAHILVLSVPDLARLWEVGRDRSGYGTTGTPTAFANRCWQTRRISLPVLKLAATVFVPVSRPTTSRLRRAHPLVDRRS
jgi:hypothetical protein